MYIWWPTPADRPVEGDDYLFRWSKKSRSKEQISIISLLACHMGLWLMMNRMGKLFFPLLLVKCFKSVDLVFDNNYYYWYSEALNYRWIALDWDIKSDKQLKLTLHSFNKLSCQPQLSMFLLKEWTNWNANYSLRHKVKDMLSHSVEKSAPHSVPPQRHHRQLKNTQNYNLHAAIDSRSTFDHIQKNINSRPGFVGKWNDIIWWWSSSSSSSSLALISGCI